MKRSEAIALRAIIEKAATRLSDEDAMNAVTLFPAWAIGKEYEVGDRVRFGNRLFKVRQAHTSQENWNPDDSASLFEVVALPTEEGTAENPIAYSLGMALSNGLYYTENETLYHCTRDTGIPVYNFLSELVGIYVEVA